MRKTLLVVAGAVAAIAAGAGCSGGGGGGGAANAVTGTIGGASIDVQSAISTTLTLDTAGALQVTVGVLTDMPNACDMLTAGQVKQNAKLVVLEMGNFTGSTVTPPSATGDYTAYTGTGTPPANFFFGSYVALDTSCQGPSMSPSINSGTLTLSSVTPDVKGSGSDIGFDTGDTVGVKFDFQDCPALAVALTTTSGGSCIP